MKKFYKNHWPLFFIGAFAIYCFILVCLVLNIELSPLQAILIAAGGPCLIMLIFGDPYEHCAGLKFLLKPFIKLYNHITKRNMCQINDVYFYPGTVFNEFTIGEALTILRAMIEIHDCHKQILHSKLFSIPIVYKFFPGTNSEQILVSNLNELSKNTLREIFQTLCGYNETHRLKELRYFQYGGL